MPWKRLRSLPLAWALSLLLVPLLSLLAVAELRVTAHDVKRSANAAYDRSLLGALKAIDANVSTESGGLSVELPYRMFEFFELTASGPVNFRVATIDGLVELGSPDLPRPPQPLRVGVPVFYDGVYFGEPVRVVAYLRELERPTVESPARRLEIQVAESMRSRQEFRDVFVRRAALVNGVFLLLALAVAVGVIVLVLRPLGSVSAAIARRAASDLTPVDEQLVPADVRPLVGAMNQHIGRIGRLVAQQRAFLDDASHQLRTHLTTMRMQVDYARGEADPAQVRTALDALSAELQRATRSTNQLLNLGRSDTAPLQSSRFATGELLAEVAREFLMAARAKGIDLGVEGGSCEARGDRELLREALSNLVSNAIAYVPGGTVTLSSAEDEQGWSMAVEDNGPGLPADLVAGLGSRFVRGAGRTGSGLGLAIAQSIAQRHGGALVLEPAAPDRGLRATLRWPRSEPEPRP